MSIRVNFAYKSLLTVSFYLMSFISFPYISRLFGVERLGLVNFVDNTVNYFLLFATMGINTLGVREIAAVKDDRESRSKVAAALLGINLLFTLATLVVYFVVIATIPRLREYSDLFYLGAVKILFTALIVEWFFTGIENFKYITLRSIAIRSCYIAAIFLTIRHGEQYRLYWLLSVAAVVINAVVNLAYARRYIDLHLKDLQNLRYMKSNLTLGIYAIMTSMYLTFNVMYLGLVTDNTEVGYYTTAFKVYSVILGFFSAFASVMLPRMSAIVAAGDKQSFERLVIRSFDAVATFSTPIVLCSTIFAPQIIRVLAGTGYEGAVVPMQIIMPTICLVAISQVMTLQVLMPMRRERILLIISIVGAAVSVIANALIVKQLHSIGSAIVLLVAEVVVTLLCAIAIHRDCGIRLPISLFCRELVLSLPSAAIALVASRSIDSPFIALAVGGIPAVAVWSALHLKTLKVVWG
jgi:O-antigen/teichoic acid export membrane protein